MIFRNFSIKIEKLLHLNMPPALLPSPVFGGTLNVLLSTFRNFSIEMEKLLRLGIKKTLIFFVLLSTFRNFAA